MQLQILTAIVKLFLQKPQGTQELVQRALSLATQDSDNPDLRDRGYIYWRLLSTDPAAAKVCACACSSPSFLEAGVFFYMHVEVFPLWMLESFFYGYVWFLLVLLVSFTCDLMSYLSLFCVSATSTGGCFQQTRPPQRCVLPPTPFDCQKVTQLNTHLFPSNCISMRLLQSFLYGYACFSFVLLVSFTCHLVCHIFACDFFSSSAL